MRPVEDLVNTAEDAWPELLAELSDSPAPVRVLPVDEPSGRRCLYRMQVTSRSRLGAMALHAGGLVVDHGWLRLYGGGDAASGLPSLAEVNGFDGSPRYAPASFAVGHDVIGGRYEVNGPVPPPGRPGAPGEVCYFAPDTLAWEPLEMPYGVFLSWLAAGATEQFYDGLRWPGWQDEVAALRLDQGLTVYPFLCTAEARRDLAATSRAPAPIAQVVSFTASLAAQLGEIPDGGSFAVRITD
ncbi:DUF2625 family protein [Catellatospora sp. NPDC049609]|uniref:DUF2625 family protein n=1 Tax=Catellatospora sp. NPDC049609 TaxID=3155505 RepID=UPI0034294638